MTPIIKVSKLSKSYGKVKAVKDVNFQVNEGELFAFLGPNGAGKTTTIDIVCTLLKPDNGVVTVNGYKLGENDEYIRKSIGIVFQDSLLDDLLTVKENLFTRGSFYKLKRNKLSEAIEKAANVTDVSSFINRPYGKLSGGQRRRADIARALIHTPKILFLDEPTIGLDPQTRKSVWDTIRNLQKETGMTVFLTTHYMEEAASADYMAIIDDGEITAEGTPSYLKNKYSRDTLKIFTKETEALIKYLNIRNIGFTKFGNTFIITVPSTLEALPIIRDSEKLISGFEVMEGNMDDVFVNITGKEMREDHK
ncbi:MAG: ATP-binding cassette domain-containing protein [Actinobacteria bacterium]|nr:ATP-binding cassette domain-containing protein [Actinomycetota bacterium]